MFVFVVLFVRMCLCSVQFCHQHLRFGNSLSPTWFLSRLLCAGNHPQRMVWGKDSTTLQETVFVCDYASGGQKLVYVYINICISTLFIG